MDTNGISTNEKGDGGRPQHRAQSNEEASVIVCTTAFNLGNLKTCLQSLKNQTNPVEIVLVTRKQLPEEIRSLATKCVVEPRKGLSIARNIGISQAEGNAILFTDDDCIAELDWAEEICSSLVREDVGLTTGRTSAMGEGYKVAHSDHRKNTQEFKFDGTYFDKHWEIGHGNNMGIKRKAIEKIGLFDDQLGAGSPNKSAEDADYFIRVLYGGYSVIYNPAAVVLHSRSGYLGYFQKRYMMYAWGRGAMLRKHEYLMPELSVRESYESMLHRMFKSTFKAALQLQALASLEYFTQWIWAMRGFHAYDLSKVLQPADAQLQVPFAATTARDSPTYNRLFS